MKDLPGLLESPETGPAPKSGPEQSIRAVNWIHRAIRIYADRFGEALPLFRPLPAAMPFYASRAWHRLVVGSNRSGKTLHTAVEIARVLTGRDPYRKCPKHDGRMMAVGVDEDHIGDVMWHKLASPGAFRILRDPETGLWRSVSYDPEQPNRVLPYDLEHKHEWRLSPPLIPPRLIQEHGIAWKVKKRNVPAEVHFRSGWECMFFSSLARPKGGIDADFGWFDEEIGNEQWYPEMVARLLDREGIFVWDGTPQRGTEQFYELQEKCRAGKPGFEEFHLKIADNPYISERRKEEWLDTFIDEEERQMRYEGINIYAGLRTYPEFSPTTTHGIAPFPIPRDWTIYVTIDPGTQVTAVLFTALRFDSRQVHAFGELYLRRHDARQTAEAIKAFLNDRIPEAFIIDMRAGRQTPMGQATTIADTYSREFEKVDLRSEVTEHGFIEGSDNIETRTMAVKLWLRPMADTGQPYFVVHKGCCPNLEREMKLQKFKRNRPNERERVPDSHVVHCLEYTAAYNPQKISRAFDGNIVVDTSVVDALAAKQERLAAREGRRRRVISLGPNVAHRRTG